MIKNIKILISYYKLIKKQYLIAMIIGSIISGLNVFILYFYPIILQNLIDFSVTMKEFPLKYCFQLIILFFMILFLNYIGKNIFIKNIINSQMDIRTRLFKYSFILPNQEVKKIGSTYYSRLINEDVAQSFNLFFANFVENIFTLLRVIPILITVFIWDWKLFILFLSTIIFYFIYSFLENKITRSGYENIFKKYGNILHFINETLEKIFTVQIFNYKYKRTKNFVQLADDLNKENKKLEIQKNNLRILFLDLTSFSIRILVILYSINSLLKGNITIGQVFALLTYFSYISSPLENLKYLNELLISCSVLAERIMNFIKYCESFKVKGDMPLTVVDTANIIVIKDLSKKYDDAIILDNISFNINNKEIIGIVGISGEGKSTLIDILLGFDRKYDGEILIYNQNIKYISASNIVKIIQYYPQTSEIFDLDLCDNIILGSEYDEKLYNEIISLLEINYLEKRKFGQDGVTISGGEKTKISLARFLYNLNFKNLFIMDEPLLSLDSITKNNCLNLLKLKIVGKAGIIISHDFDILNKLVNKYIVLDNGKIVEIGTKDELIKQGRLFQKLYSTFYNLSN